MTSSQTRIVIHGHPVAKGRPRVRLVRTGHGKTFASAYTPAKTRDAEDSVAGAAARALERGEAHPIMEGAIVLEVTLWRQVPKSASRVQRDAMLRNEQRPTTKPDADNCAKLVTDALNGLLYRDDAQITDLVVRKRYAETPHTEIVMRPAVCDGRSG